MYANQDGNLFNQSKLYAFLRKCSTEVLLVVANFSKDEVECSVRLPHHAFECLNLQEKKVTAVDLISEENTITFNLKPECLVSMSVPGYGGCVYKFKV